MALKGDTYSGNTETPFEEKGYLARIVGITDLGQQKETKWDKEKETFVEADPVYKVQITYEFPTVRNQNDNPSWLSKNYNFPSKWPKMTLIKNNSNLFKLFALFVPHLLKKYAKNELYYSFDQDRVWDELLNKEAYVEVILNKNQRPRIKSVTKVPDFVDEVPSLENNTYIFSAPYANVEEWKALYPWVRQIILNALDDETIKATSVLEEQLVELESIEEAPVEVDTDDDTPY